MRLTCCDGTRQGPSWPRGREPSSRVNPHLTRLVIDARERWETATSCASSPNGGKADIQRLKSTSTSWGVPLIFNMKAMAASRWLRLIGSSRPTWTAPAGCVHQWARVAHGRTRILATPFQYLFLVYFSVEKLMHQRPNPIHFFFQCEMARIEKMELCAGNISFKDFSTLHREDSIVFAPRDQRRGLMFTEVLLPIVVNVQISLRVIED